jgi:hypothetical protein
MGYEHKLPLRPYISQYHCTTLRTLSPSDMCTSLAPGFYIRDKFHFMSWKEQIMRIKEAYKDECIFSVFLKTPSFMRDMSESANDSSSNSFELISMP